ncbi:MAG: hypothetical protein GXO35_04205 [Gammaproteobacteria bacterium]|nr:hypothetical protein [Gammaproteobacteria bacterium]
MQPNERVSGAAVPSKETAGESYFAFCGHGWRAAQPRPLNAGLGMV